MEKIVSNLKIFEEYQNRQVVFNYYQNEDYLLKRDGFQFNTVHLEDEQMLFYKQNVQVAAISLKDFESISQNNEFPHYYIFRDGNNRLEVYFP